MRFKILYENGGFYLDTDVELIKSLDEFLNKKAIMGFENSISSISISLSADAIIA